MLLTSSFPHNLKGGDLNIKRKKDNHKIKCKECGRDIEYGGDLITIEKCVNGPRGIIPLGEKEVFCNEECLGNFFGNFNGRELPKVPPRIP